MFDSETRSFSRTINWVETILRGLIQYMVQELCRLLAAKLQSKRSQVSMILKKWSLNGLGTIYIGWMFIAALTWVLLTLNFATQHGYATANGILAFGGTTIGMIFSIGLPGLGLNRLALRADPEHWVVRITASFSPTDGIQHRSLGSRQKLSYVQAFPAVIRRNPRLH